MAFDEPFEIEGHGPPGWRRRRGTARTDDAERRRHVPGLRVRSPRSPNVLPMQHAPPQRTQPPSHATDRASTRSPIVTLRSEPGTDEPVPKQQQQSLIEY